MKKFQLRGASGNLEAWCELPQGLPIKGILQLVHGMAEHSRVGAYRDWVTALLIEGYAVYSVDLVGMGMNAKEPMGHVRHEEAWEEWTSCIHALNLHCRDTHPGIPVVVFGHSMGSYLAQDFAIKYPDLVDGVILSASSCEHPWLLWIGYWVSRVLGGVFGYDRPGIVVYRILFGGFNKAFMPSRTSFDWLTRDEAYLQTYIQDTWCTYVPTYMFYQAFFLGLARFFTSSPWSRLYLRIPMLFVSGTRDPLGKNGRSIGQLVQNYRQTGHDVVYHTYDKGRHVMLAETNKDEVILAIGQWLGHTLLKLTKKIDV